MNSNCIAIDLGASSGRVIQGRLIEGKFELREIHRFMNETVIEDGQLCWDLDLIFNEILSGLIKCKSFGIAPDSIGIDSWGVDFVLLDVNNEIIGNPVAYRDNRTDDIMDDVFNLISKEGLYEKTGIQFMQFNTLFQLFALKAAHPKDINGAKTLLFLPDYINFLMTGNLITEYTIASTSQLLNVHSRDWDHELTELINDNRGMFNPLIQPGVKIGKLSQNVEDNTGLTEVSVVSVPSHDTASAVAAAPTNGKNWAYISSGTWSLMGIEVDRPITSDVALKYNFTNEGGVFGTIRLLKNLMGLWLFQEVKKLLGRDYHYSELISEASASEPFKFLVNPNDQRFFNPENMIDEIKSFCRETGQSIPQRPGEICRCIFDSLAFQYRQVLEELKEVQNIPIYAVHVVGGGSQNELLNQLCANATGLDVYAGPVEATALGNLMFQNISLGKIKTLGEGRRIIKKSFDIRKYSPMIKPELGSKWQFFKGLVY